MKVLVAAASDHGATADIARVIGDRLAAMGVDVTVLPAEEVVSLTGFDGVVLGSAVYGGHWLEPGKLLADRIGTELGDRPVWLFSSGVVGDTARKLVQQMDVDPVDLPALMAVTGARGHRRFPGKLDRRQFHGLERLGLRIFPGMEGDFRDWDAVQTWADDIAAQLPPGAPVVAPTDDVTDGEHR